MFNKFYVKEENMREGAKIANDQEEKKGKRENLSNTTNTVNSSSLSLFLSFSKNHLRFF
jgi:hypothetical protein